MKLKTGSLLQQRTGQVYRKWYTSHKWYCIIFKQPMQENASSLAVIFVPFLSCCPPVSKMLNIRHTYIQGG